MGAAVLEGDRWAPVTSVIGFVKAPVDKVCSALEGWRRDLFGDVRVTRLGPGLSAALDTLDPLSIGGVSTELLLETESEWTAWFDDDFSNGALVSSVSVITRRIKVSGVVVTSAPHSSAHGQVRWGARQLQMFGPDQTEFINYVRTISAVNNGGRWRFDAAGQVQPFEATENYRRRRVADRFTEVALVDYCAALGLRPFDASFFSGGGVVVKSNRPELERVSRSEARMLRGIG